MFRNRSKTLSYTRWIVFIIQTYYCFGGLCPLELSNCSQFGMSCTVKRHDKCFSPYLRMPPPGPVTSFDVQIHYQPVNSTPIRITEPSLHVSWKLPANNTHKYLSGFELSIWSVEDNDHACFTYELTNSRWTESPSMYKYIYTCASLPEGQYNVEVSSLPHSAFCDVKATAIIRVLGRETDCSIHQASCWRTDIVVYSRPCDKRVHVQFKMAPDETGISDYLVTLISKSSFFGDASESIRHVSGKTSGNVVLNISTPLPLYERVILVRPSGRVCELNNCLISATQPFNITIPTEKECIINSCSPHNHSTTKPANLATTDQPTPITAETSTENGCRSNCSIPPGTSPGLTRAAVSGIIIACVLLSAVLIGIIILISRKVHGNTKRVSQLSGKIIYVMYSYDNEYHQRVVEHLVNFLESLRSCNVIYDQRHQGHVSERSLWVKDAIKRSDRILLVTSEGCYRRSLLIQNSEVSPSADTFTPAYKLIEEDVSQGNGSLINKLILVHFAYTPPEYRNIGLCSLLRDQVNYQLMEDIVQVYKLIHGSANEHIVSNLSNRRGELTRYIDSAARYIQNNPNWFTDNYVSSSANSDTINADLITLDTTQYDKVNYTRSNSLPPNCPPAIYLNLSMLYPRILDDNDTITSSVLGDIVDEINMSS